MRSRSPTEASGRAQPGTTRGRPSQRQSSPIPMRRTLARPLLSRVAAGQCNLAEGYLFSWYNQAEYDEHQQASIMMNTSVRFHKN